MPTTLSNKARPGRSIAIRVERGQKENLGPIQQRTDSPVHESYQQRVTNTCQVISKSDPC